MLKRRRPEKPTLGRTGKGQDVGPGSRPHVVVKFRDDVEIPYEDGAEQHVVRMKLGPWEELAKSFLGIGLKRQFTALKPDRIHELVRRAMEIDKTYRPPNLLTYFIIHPKEETDLDGLAAALNKWPAVQTAYVDRPGPDPVVNAGDDPLSNLQGYLDPAPDGIDAEYAWGFLGGDGAGQRLIDLERGWTLNHEDLAGHGATLLHGTLLDTSRAHGTSVLGEVCAVDNTLGCVGIVPQLASVDVVSFHDSTRPDAIAAAIDNMAFGDVLLLEAQIWDYADPLNPILGPVECYDAEYDMIRLATALGIVVVEAGGNGTNGAAPALNLDTYVNPAGLHILNRDPTNPDFRDSGAIIVTAASSAAPHTRLGYGPHGRRIDCYGWGENVDTCSSDALGATNSYTMWFSGTSSASPIIAGAALAVQGLAQAALGYRFSPHELRQILSDPANGTAPAATETTHIGVLPNLRAIIDSSALNLAPDVYIRDNVLDTGDPHTGSISSSPDIILLKTAVANPQATYGEGSGTENSNTLGSLAEIGQDNYIYVRVHNRGGSNAANVVASVFWAPVGTLLTPDMWTPVGSVTIPNVPVGDILTVSDAITWPEAQIPAEGHYCFIGLVGNAQDPAPGPADMLDWDNFYRFIRENNNVTWRNFNVKDNDPDPAAGDPEGYVALEFLASGAPDRARPMKLEVGARLPKGARVMLEGPRPMLEMMYDRTPYGKALNKGRTVRVPVHPHSATALREVRFPAKSRSRFRLLVQIPKEYRKNDYEVYVRQIFEKQEVGRVTWRLSPKGRRQRPVKQGRR
jgi:hypothetical protein